MKSVSTPMRDWLAHRLGGEFRAVVRPDVAWDTPVDEKIREPLEHVLRVEAPGDVDGQALAGVLIHDREHPQLAPVPRRVLDEVVGPDVVLSLRPQPHAGAVVEP